MYFYFFLLDGEIYLEQKYPVTRDPIAGDQFSIVDDGYLWSSIPKPEIQEHQGQVTQDKYYNNLLIFILLQQVEVSKWTEGYSPGDKLFTVFKTEYRLNSFLPIVGFNCWNTVCD